MCAWCIPLHLQLSRSYRPFVRYSGMINMLCRWQLVRWCCGMCRRRSWLPAHLPALWARCQVNRLPQVWSSSTCSWRSCPFLVVSHCRSPRIAAHEHHNMLQRCHAAGNAALRMQQEIRQQEGMPAPAGGFSAAPPASSAHAPQQQQQHQVLQQPAASNPGVAAASGDGAHGSPQASDPDCLDGTTETRDSGSMVDWMLSVASKPRSSGNGSPQSGAADSSSNIHEGDRASAAVQPPVRPASDSNGVGGGKSGGSGHILGGRGGVVSALAVETPEALPAPVATAPLPAEPAPAPEDCEPDWQLRASGMSGLGALGLLTKPQQRSHRGSVGVQVAQQQQQQAVALRRHNNQLLAEAGVLSNVMPWIVTASSQAAVQEAQSEEATAPKPQQPAGNVQEAAGAPAPAATVDERPHGEMQLDDYII
jgi:hypothetical protein